MWPRSAETLYGGLEPPASNENDLNFDFFVSRMEERVTACLRERLGLILSGDAKSVPISLLFNKYDDPLWCDLGRGYGAGQTEAAIKALKNAQNVLHTSEDGKQPDLRAAYEACISLPRPASIFLDHCYALGPDEFSQVVEHLIVLYSIQLKEAREWGGNARAKRLAIRLRAITEFYTDHPVNVGKSAEYPVGVYVECLDELYKVIGIQVHFFRYANTDYTEALAQKELASSFEFLRIYSELSG